MKEPHLVIVGTGQGGFQLAHSLREGGFAGAITLIGEERYPPYQRPPLSKAYLLGKQSADALLFRQMNWYIEHNIRLRTNIRVVAIERDARRIRLDDGSSQAYDLLALATGARIRPLTIEGADLDGVVSIRSLDDADAIAARLEHVARVAIIGGGFIGLEFAAVARMLGKTVTVIEMQPRLMARAVPPILSCFFADLHRSNGVDLILGQGVARILGREGHVAMVETSDGSRIDADLVVVGIGVDANDELAGAAGLTCHGGIEVDAELRTNDERIFALGDCVQHHNAFADARMRVESVQNAVDQARCVAANIMGQHLRYRAVPWFWSDQYDCKLQMVGFSTGLNETILRGDPTTRHFSAFYFRDAALLGIDSVNRAADHMLGRRLIERGITLPKPAVADESVNLKAFLD